MSTLIVFIFIAAILWRSAAGKNLTRKKSKKDTTGSSSYSKKRKSTAEKTTGNRKTAEESASGASGQASRRFPRRPSKPKPDLYKLEDRENDWLARQIREESVAKNAIEREIRSVKLMRQMERKRRDQ